MMETIRSVDCANIKKDLTCTITGSERRKKELFLFFSFLFPPDQASYDR